MKIYVGIDGTNNNDTTDIHNSQTVPSNVTSFVKRIGLLGFEKFHYLPGTHYSVSGIDTASKGREAANWVLRQLPTASDGVRPGVFLGGFSRGGLSAIVAANHLVEQGVVVDGLFLFDAVDRTPSVTAFGRRTIPEAVKKAYHAIRSKDSGSRPGFGTIDDSLQDGGGNLEVKEFRSTHGAIGGWRHGSENLVHPMVESHHSGTANSTAGMRQQWSQQVHTEHRPLFPDRVTNVTPLQQLSTSLAAWAWMQGNVEKAKQDYVDATR